MAPTPYTLDQLPGLVGQHLGYSEWIKIDQNRINLFAEATGDHQWIHVDPARAAQGPFGATIAHGYLTLSLIPTLAAQVWTVTDLTMAINYGCNKVRFPAPVKVDSELRLGLTLASIEEIPGGFNLVLSAALEVRDADRPSCVAEVVLRYLK
jgi:acyl dehydratase